MVAKLSEFINNSKGFSRQEILTRLVGLLRTVKTQKR